MGTLAVRLMRGVSKRQWLATFGSRFRLQAGRMLLEWKVQETAPIGDDIAEN